MNGFPIRRAFSILLRLIPLSAASALTTGLILSRIGDGTVYAALPGPSALSWLGPCALFCLFAMAAGTTVFSRALLCLGCVWSGAAFGTVCALTADGLLLTAHPAAAVMLCGAELLLRLWMCAAAGAGSEALTVSFGRGDAVGFRSALRSGFGASLTSAGCVMAASLLLRLAAVG